MKLSDSYFEDKIRNLDQARKPRMAFTHDEVIKEFIDIGREADALNYINYCANEDLKYKNSELTETIVKLKVSLNKSKDRLKIQKYLTLGIAVFVGVVCLALLLS
jgi:hypothetical protein